MREAELCTAVVSVMNAAFASLVADGAPVITSVRLYQPTNQGERSEPTFYFYVGDTIRYGFPQRKTVYIPAPDDIIRTVVTQQLHTPIQGMGVYHQAPTDTAWTASDIANAAALLLSTNEVLAALRALGLAPLRITQVRNPSVINGEGQYQFMPNFDFVLTHEQTIVTETPAALSTGVKIVSV